MKGTAVKCRLAVKDYNDGTTNTELYAGTPAMSSLRAILARASWNMNDPAEQRQWIVATADITTAFMHAEIPPEEKVFVRAPPELPSTSDTDRQ